MKTSIEGLRIFHMGTSMATEAVPARPGIYAFYLALGNRSSLGLYSGENDSKALGRAREAFSRQLASYRHLNASRRYTGQTVDADRSRLLSRRYKVSMSEDVPKLSADALESMSDKQFLELVDLISDLNFLSHPIYIGKADKQSLKTRCAQHEKDYKDGTRNNFGTRLKDSGFVWSDLIFVCRPLQHLGLELELPEKILHALVTPILSMR